MLAGSMRCSSLLWVLAAVAACGDDRGTAADAGGDGAVVDSGNDGAADSHVPSDGTPPMDGATDAPVMDAAVRCSDAMRTASPFGGGTGTAGDPWVICTPEHLVAVATEPTGHFVLWEDLDVEALPDDYQIPELQGSFDGQGHIIANYAFVPFLSSNGGLFGELGDDATVRRLTLEGVRIDIGSGGFAGALAGQSSGAIVDCHVVSGTVTGGGAVGGLVGAAQSVIGDPAREIRDSTSAAMVVGDPGADGVGGIVGASGSRNLRLENVAFTGEVVSETGTSVGGIAGQLAPTTLVGASSTGRVVGSREVGGLVGTFFTGSIERSFSTGAVTGQQGVGGLVGAANSGAVTIADSYSQADVRDVGPGRLGTTVELAGLVGDSTAGAALTIERCYFGGSLTIDVGPSTDIWVGGLVSGRGVRTIDTFNAGVFSITARTANVGAVYILESYGTMSNVYYDASRTDIDVCWVNQMTPSPDCAPVNVGDSAPDYFFDPSSPPMDAWDFSATGPWRMVAGGFPELR